MILNWAVFSRRHSAHSEGIFSCHNLGDTTGIWWAVFRDAKHLNNAQSNPPPFHKELSGPKYQQF